MKIKKTPRPHLEIQKAGNNYYGVIRSTYREDGKIKHTNQGTIKNKTLGELKLLQAAFRGDVVLKKSQESDKQGLTVKNSKEYGASFAALQIAKQTGLDKLIYSRTTEQWVKDCLAMIAGRLVYSGSKLSLTNRWKDTSLWELCGVNGKIDVEAHCYKPMDHLIERQEAIQKGLADKHLKKGAIVLYDITSSYFEGEYNESEIVKFGYNRDGKRGHEQMVIGLICNEEGCPIGVEVFAGNTQDASTVPDKIAELREKYKIEELVFVGDRGMITSANYEKVKDIKGLNTISALTHRQIVWLLNRKVIQIDMFDEKEIVEVVDPEDLQRRYCLCRNPATAEREDRTRKSLMEVVKKGLEKISKSKRSSSNEKISARVGKILSKTKMGKFVEWTVENGRLVWKFKQDKVDDEEMLDGCYIISANVPKEVMDKEKIVSSYKKLIQVESAFRNLKTVRLEVRPVFHMIDNRIRAHVFICMLAYYLQWHFKKSLKPLFNTDGKRKHRFWTFENVIERLKSIRKEIVQIQGIDYTEISKPDDDQQKILELLNIKM